MKKQKLSEISLLLYCDEVLIDIYKPYYIGKLGIFIKNYNIEYPNSCRLSVEVRGSALNIINGLKIPVVIASITALGSGLMPKCFDPFYDIHWKMIRNSVSPLQNNLIDINYKFNILDEKNTPLTERGVVRQQSTEC